tara:strand:+ start:159185 stop:159511 length:327 start_codon:yes stop_codon:yes gene_type:complete
MIGIKKWLNLTEILTIASIIVLIACIATPKYIKYVKSQEAEQLLIDQKEKSYDNLVAERDALLLKQAELIAEGDKLRAEIAKQKKDFENIRKMITILQEGGELPATPQ